MQPVAVSLDATDFRLYKGGILDDVNCFNVTNHGVTVVGYGVSSAGVNYWIVKTPKPQNPKTPSKYLNFI